VKWWVFLYEKARKLCFQVLFHKEKPGLQRRPWVFGCNAPPNGIAQAIPKGIAQAIPLSSAFRCFFIKKNQVCSADRGFLDARLPPMGSRKQSPLALLSGAFS
jgi:hypothetical protein